MTDQVTRTNGTAARIRELRRELAELEQQQHDELLRAIADVYPGAVFNASQIWQQPELHAAFVDAGLSSVKQLGRWLRQSGIDRVGRDGDGCLWNVSADDLHDDTGIGRDDDV